MDDATSVSIALADATATRALGSLLASAVQPGTIILLRGQLGAGKTTLADGFAQTLGANAATSPTFVIAHWSGSGRIPLWHLDLYRMENEIQVQDLDLAQYISEDAITLCEWPERAAGFWPADTLSVDLGIEGHGRRAHLRSTGPKSNRLLDAVRPRIAPSR